MTVATIKGAKTPPKALGYNILLKCVEKAKTEGGIYLPGSGEKTDNKEINYEYTVYDLGSDVDEQVRSYLKTGTKVYIDFKPAINPVVSESKDADGNRIFFLFALPSHILGYWDN